MTRSGSNRTNPAPRNPPWILLGVITASQARIKHSRNLSFVMQVKVIQLHMRSLAQRLYAFFKGVKQPTSRGYRRCDECRGIQIVIILFSLQYYQNTSESQLLQPLIMSSQWLLTTLFFICSLKYFNYCRPSLFVVQPFSETVITQSQGRFSSLYQAER